MTTVADEDGELRGWGKAAAFVAVMVPVFVSAFVIGRLTGPEAPGADGPQRPATAPAQNSGGGSRGDVGGEGGAGDGDGDEGSGHNHGLAPFGPAFAPPAYVTEVRADVRGRSAATAAEGAYRAGHGDRGERSAG